MVLTPAFVKNKPPETGCLWQLGVKNHSKMKMARQPLAATEIADIGHALPPPSHSWKGDISFTADIKAAS